MERKKRRKGHIKATCSNCDEKLDTVGRYCKKCKAAYTRNWRKTHKLTAEQRFKDNVRSKLHMRIRRGLMKKRPCVICFNPKVEGHHYDYNKPYDVIWLCRQHHMEHHKILQLSKGEK